jgi:dipeptidyl aminopeptidase/acylaminoacyl peptidase
MRRIGPVLLSALALGVSTPSLPAGAAFPGVNGTIAFDSDRDVAAGEIYAIAPGGTATRLTFSNGSSNPAYSPDGRKIAFVDSDYQISVMNQDGSGEKQITTTPTAKQDPAWSPNGARILYVANSFDVDGETDLEIWSIKVDGTGRKQLTNNTFPDMDPAWSPLGDQIAFVSARMGDTNRNVYIMNADGSGPANLTPNSAPGCTMNCYGGHDDHPAWSPSGDAIAYVHSQEPAGGGIPAIWTMTPSGAGKANLSNNEDVSFVNPAWSPEGDKLAAVGTEAFTTNRDIWMMDSDGSDQVALDEDAAHDTNPDWQPVTFQPDGSIKLGGGAFAGNDVYNTNGANQTRSTKAVRGQTKTFTVKIQNDGSATDSFGLDGTGGSGQWVVTYFFEGTNVTPQVVAGTFSLDDLAPRAAENVTLKIKPKANAGIGSSRSVLVTATSEADPSAEDTVKAKVTVKQG